MPYLTYTREINQFIASCTNSNILWIDTEVADFTTKKPRLSLIQVLDDPTDMSGNRVFILDVLDQPEVVTDFIDLIMLNPAIEKVFHNANYDLKFLGGKKTKNVTCTLEIAKKIPYHILPVANYKLQTLVAELCGFEEIDKQQQTSDWGQRPLTDEQVDYAYLDCIYLAQIHQKLLKINHDIHSDPINEDIISLTKRYKEIEEDYKFLHSEIEYLEDRIKKAMQAQNIVETPDFKLNTYERTSFKVSFVQLAEFINTKGIKLDFPVALTQKLQKDLGDSIEQLDVDREVSINYRLTSRNQEDKD